MRQKISTLIHPGLYRRVKLESVRRNMQISEIVGEALEEFLAKERRSPPSGGIAEESWGAIAAPREQVEEILRNEPALLDG